MDVLNTSYSRADSGLNNSIVNEDTDDLIVGDRVWVYGTKPGYIQYIGETQFAPGVWAGIVLDEYEGKHDGMVSGVRYFQCEPKRGIFSRLHRLTRLPYSVDGKRIDHGIIKRTSKMTPSGKVRTTTTTFDKTPRIINDTPSYALPSRPSKIITTVTTTTTAHNKNPNSPIRIGEKVVVNSSRGMQTGRVRYFGRAQFATGEWVGIELDEPFGKNDGSVAGRRYFTCPMKYGLFAPVHKVVRGEPIRTITRTRVESSPTQTWIN